MYNVLTCHSFPYRLIGTAAVVLAIAMPAVGAESKGALEGTVKIVALPAEERSSSGADYGSSDTEPRLSPAERRQAELKNVVVYLKGGPAVEGNAASDGDVGSASQPLEIKQLDKAFVPAVLPVLAGSKVRFPNEDPFYHNVFSLSSCCKFDLGKYGQTGPTGDVTFDHPGVAKIFCDIHRNMKAYVLVLENAFFTQPDEQGHFLLEQIPPGQWEVHAWHPVLGDMSSATDVRPGQSATLDLSLGGKQ